MLKDEMIKELNKQINAELYSAYLYLDFASYFEEKGLTGFAHWYRLQAKEEMAHAMMFYDYVHTHGAYVKLEQINKPSGNYKDDLSVLKQALDHEKYVTGLVNELVFLAREQRDLRTEHFLTWFVNEQAEEEATASELIDKYTLFGKDSSGLYAINEELANRSFTPPTNDAM